MANSIDNVNNGFLTKVLACPNKEAMIKFSNEAYDLITDKIKNTPLTSASAMTIGNLQVIQVFISEVRYFIMAQKRPETMQMDSDFLILKPIAEKLIQLGEWPKSALGMFDFE